tara:strand:- start:1480 stop:1911 length:432 start_codon:yes stop_codon:yes gene_type:complete
MATEILVNDGGAPARILPYTAGVALTAGQAVMASTTVAYEVVLADTGVGLSVLGYALTNTAAGDNASIITGKGVILNVQALPGTAGAALCIGGAAAGQLAAATNDTVVAVNNRFAPCAMILKLLQEDGTGTIASAGLWRVQTL